MANEEVSNIGVRLTLDASNFNRGINTATGKMNAFQTAAQQAGAGARRPAGGGTGAPGGPTGGAAGATPIAVEIAPAQLNRALRAASAAMQPVAVPIVPRDVRGFARAITAQIGAVPVTVQPRFATTGPQSFTNVLTSMLTMQYGVGRGAARQMAREVVANVRPVSQVEHRWSGGPVHAGRGYVVGEKRAEVFRPGATGWIERDIREYRRREAELAALEFQIQQRQKRVGHAQAGRRVFSTELLRPGWSDFARWPTTSNLTRREWEAINTFRNEPGAYAWASPMRSREFNYGGGRWVEMLDRLGSLQSRIGGRDLAFPNAPRGYTANPLDHLMRAIAGQYGLPDITESNMLGRITRMEGEIERARKQAHRVWPPETYGEPDWLSPIGFFHATTNMPAILREGVRSGSEVQASSGMTSGLGGANQFVSTTWSLSRARQLASSMRMLARTARGEASPRQLANYFEHRAKMLVAGNTVGETPTDLLGRLQEMYPAFTGGNLTEMFANAIAKGTTPGEYGPINPAFEVFKHLDSMLAFSRGASEVGEGALFMGTGFEQMRQVNPRNVGVVQLAMRRPPLWQKRRLQQGRPQGLGSTPWDWAHWYPDQPFPEENRLAYESYERANTNTDWMEHGIKPAEYEMRIPSSLLTVIGRRLPGGPVEGPIARRLRERREGTWGTDQKGVLVPPPAQPAQPAQPDQPFEPAWRRYAREHGLGKDLTGRARGGRSLEARAIRHFGTTEDIREAGYITPSGKFLDFSGRHESGWHQGDPDFHKGQRWVPHQDAATLFPRRRREYESQSVEWMTNAGFVRVGHADPWKGEFSAEISRPINDVQRAAIRREMGSGAYGLFDVSDRKGSLIGRFGDFPGEENFGEPVIPLGRAISMANAIAMGRRRRQGGGRVFPGYEDWLETSPYRAMVKGPIKISPEERALAGLTAENYRLFMRLGENDPARAMFHRRFYERSAKNMVNISKVLGFDPKLVGGTTALFSSNAGWPKNLFTAVQFLQAQKVTPGMVKGLFASQEQQQHALDLLAGVRDVSGIKRQPFGGAFWDPNALPIDRWAGRVGTMQGLPPNLIGAPASVIRAELLKAVGGERWGMRQNVAPITMRRPLEYGIRRVASELGMQPRHVQAEPWGWIRDLARESGIRRAGGGPADIRRLLERPGASAVAQHARRVDFFRQLFSLPETPGIFTKVPPAVLGNALGILGRARGDTLAVETPTAASLERNLGFLPEKNAVVPETRPWFAGVWDRMLGTFAWGAHGGPKDQDLLPGMYSKDIIGRVGDQTRTLGSEVIDTNEKVGDYRFRTTVAADPKSLRMRDFGELGYKDRTTEWFSRNAKGGRVHRALGGIVHPTTGFLPSVMQTAADWASDPFMAMMAYQQMRDQRQGRAIGGPAFYSAPKGMELAEPYRPQRHVIKAIDAIRAKEWEHHLSIRPQSTATQAYAHQAGLVDAPEMSEESLKRYMEHWGRFKPENVRELELERLKNNPRQTYDPASRLTRATLTPPGQWYPQNLEWYPPHGSHPVDFIHGPDIGDTEQVMPRMILPIGIHNHPLTDNLWFNRPSVSDLRTFLRGEQEAWVVTPEQTAIMRKVVGGVRGLSEDSFKPYVQRSLRAAGFSKDTSLDPSSMQADNAIWDRFLAAVGREAGFEYLRFPTDLTKIPKGFPLGRLPFNVGGRQLELPHAYGGRRVGQNYHRLGMPRLARDIVGPALHKPYGIRTDQDWLDVMGGDWPGPFFGVTPGWRKAGIGDFQAGPAALRLPEPVGQTLFSNTAVSYAKRAFRKGWGSVVTGVHGKGGMFDEGSPFMFPMPDVPGLGRKMGRGGLSDRLGAYIVGEIGPELFVPGRLSHLIPKRVMDQIPKAAGGMQVIGRKHNELFAPPEDGWIIPHDLMGKVPHRQGGGQATAGGPWNVRGEGGRFISRAAIAAQQTAGPMPVATPGRADIDIPTFIRRMGDAVEAGASKGTMEGVPEGFSRIETPEGTLQFPQHMQGFIGPALAQGGGLQSIIDMKMPGVGIVGQTPAQRAAAQQREALTNIRGQMAETMQGMNAWQQVMSGRTPRGLIAQLSSMFGGGRREMFATQYVAREQQRELSRQLTLAPSVAPKFEEYIDLEAKLMGQRGEEAKATKAQMAELLKGDKALQGVTKTWGKLRETTEKLQPSTGGVIKNLGVIIGATSLYGMAMQGANALLQPAVEASIQATGAWTEEFLGFRSTTNRVTKDIGEAARQMGGNVQAAIGQAAGQGGLGTAGYALAQGGLAAGVTAKGGAAAAQQASDLRRAMYGAATGAAPTGLYGGYGGLLGGALFAQQLGGGKGYAETVIGDIANFAARTTMPRGQFAGRAGAIPLTAEQRATAEKNATAAMTQLTATVTDTNEAAQRYATVNVESAANVKMATKDQLAAMGVSTDAFKKMVDEQNAYADTIGGDFADRIHQMTQSNVLLVDSQGKLINSYDETTKYFQQAAGGQMIQTQKAFADQQARALKAQFAAAQEQVNYQLQTQIPGQLGMQLAAQPFIPAAAGVLPPSMPALVNQLMGGVTGANGIDIQGMLDAAQARQDQLMKAASAALDSTASWIGRQQGMGGQYTANYMGRNMTFAGGEQAFRFFTDQMTTSGNRIAKWQTQIAGAQAQVQWAQFANNLRLSNRAYADALALAGQGGGKAGLLGALERQQTMLGFGLQQRQISFQKAIAGFSVMGLTPEEQAARVQQAKYEADIAQQQLNLSVSVFGETSRRGVEDTRAALGLLKEEQNAQVAVAAAQKAIAVEQMALSQNQMQAQAVLQQAEGSFQTVLGAATTYMSQFAGTIKEATDALRTALNMGPIQTRPGGGMHPSSAGYLGSFARGATFTVGEAGTETVAILRNPRTNSMAPWGGGGSPVYNINVVIQGGGEISDERLNKWAGDILRQLDRSLGRSAALLGLRDQSFYSRTG